MIKTRSHCPLEGNRGSSWTSFQTDLDALPQKWDLEKQSLGIAYFRFNWSQFSFWSNRRICLKKLFTITNDTKQKKNSIKKNSCKTCEKIKSTQSLLSNLIYKTKTIKIGSSRIKRYVDSCVLYNMFHIWNTTVQNTFLRFSCSWRLVRRLLHSYIHLGKGMERTDETMASE